MEFTGIMLIKSLIFVTGAYVENMAPVALGGGSPIDRGKNFRDGRRILGNGKTIRGFFGGVFTGIIWGFILYFAFDSWFDPKYYSYSLKDSILVGLGMGLGANFGDIIGSFAKRRMDLKSGSSAPGLDQLGFIVPAMIITRIFIALGSLFSLAIILQLIRIVVL